MKSIKLIAGAAIMACLATSAQGITVSNSDLILGFRCTSGTGTGSDLEVDLGSISNYVGKTGSWTVANLASADIVSTYGSSWYTNSSLNYGIVGYNGLTGSNLIVWASNAQTTVGTQSEAWYLGVDGTLNTKAAVSVARGGIATLYTGAAQSMDVLNSVTLDSNQDPTTTPLSSSYSVIANESADGGAASGSWGYAEFNGTTISFKSFNPTVESSVAVASTTDYTSIDLYQLQGGQETVYVGTFSLYGDGTLVYSSSVSVPEPATYAAIMGVALGAFVMVRRKFKAVAC